MTYQQFQESFERAAQQERISFDAMTASKLLAEIAAGRLGQCYQIWSSLGARATPTEANSLLLAFLESDAPYLHRYHCADALISINKLIEWQAADLSASPKYPVEENLAKVRASLSDGG